MCNYLYSYLYNLGNFTMTGVAMSLPCVFVSACVCVCVCLCVDSLQCSLAALQGTVTAPVSFTTLSAPPEQPRPPTLQNKTKTSLHVRYGRMDEAALRAL